MQWTGTITHCQLCEKPLDGVMIDGAMRLGGSHTSWANVCEPCHKLLGVGIGTGKGQRYEWNSEEKAWIKTAG